MASMSYTTVIFHVGPESGCLAIHLPKYLTVLLLATFRFPDSVQKPDRKQPFFLRSLFLTSFIHRVCSPCCYGEKTLCLSMTVYRISPPNVCVHMDMWSVCVSVFLCVCLCVRCMLKALRLRTFSGRFALSTKGPSESRWNYRGCSEKSQMV